MPPCHMVLTALVQYPTTHTLPHLGYMLDQYATHLWHTLVYVVCRLAWCHTRYALGGHGSDDLLSSGLRQEANWHSKDYIGETSITNPYHRLPQRETKPNPPSRYAQEAWEGLPKFTSRPDLTKWTMTWQCRSIPWLTKLYHLLPSPYDKTIMLQVSDCLESTARLLCSRSYNPYKPHSYATNGQEP